MSDIQLVKIPHIIRPDHREFRGIEYQTGMTIRDATYATRREFWEAGCQYTIYKNGAAVQSLDELVMPGDFLAVQVYVAGGDFLRTIAMIGLMVFAAWAGPAIATASWGLGLTGTIATVTGSLISGAIILAGGLLINAFLPVPKPDTSADSPTYGWQGFYNPVKPGNPIPIAAGNIAAPPPIIGYYKEADTDYNMWIYFLLAATLGTTNNAITSADVLVGDELLTKYSDYTFGITSGSWTIAAADRTALAPFEDIHHWRTFDKIIKHSDSHQDPTVVLLHHYNGVDGSTTITDSSTRSSPWTAYGNAELDTADKQFGTASLLLTADGDYIDTDDFEQMRLTGNFTIEFWAKRLDAGSNCFLYQEYTCSDYIDQPKTAWALYYNATDGKFYFRTWKGQYGGSPDGVDREIIIWYLMNDLNATVTMNVGTWYYIRVQKYNETATLTVDTTIVDTVSNFHIYYPMLPDGDTYLSDWYIDIIDYADMDTILKDQFVNWVGRGELIDFDTYEYYTAGETEEGTAITTVYGHCQIDDLRITRRKPAYTMANVTVPVAELADSVSLGTSRWYVTTESNCDKVNLLLEWPALIRFDDEGGRHDETVTVMFSYRLHSGGGWTEDTQYISEEKLTPVRKNIELTFPARGQYDVSVARLTPDSDDEAKHINQFSLSGMDEIITEQLTPPGIQVACLGLKASDRISGQVPVIRLEHNRTQVAVPQFDGSGTDTISINNPAWMSRYQMTHQYEGRGIAGTALIQTAWEAWYDYCTGLVDGAQRCSVNAYFDTKGNLMDNGLAHMELAGRAKIIPVGNQWTVVIDQPWTGDPAYLFSAGNMLPGSFGWEGYEESQKVDAVEIQFLNAALNWKQDSVLVKASWYETLTRPPREARIQLIACTSREEAMRHARFHMQKTEDITRRAWWGADIEASALEIGDVVWLIHPRHNQMFSGRITNDVSASTSIPIDQTITLDTATYGSGAAKMYLRDADGNVNDYTVTGPFDTATNTITISSAVSLDRFDVWGIALPNAHKLLYQISNKTLADGQYKQFVKFEAVEYVASRFYHSSYGGGLVAI